MHQIKPRIIALGHASHWATYHIGSHISLATNGSGDPHINALVQKGQHVLNLHINHIGSCITFSNA